MPNYVKNVVRIYGDVEKIKNTVGGVSVFDFDKIIPMPDSLHIISGSVSDSAEMFVKNPKPVFKDKNGAFMGYPVNGEVTSETPYGIPSKDISYLFDGNAKPICFADFVELGKVIIFNRLKYGFPTWYEWRVKNWGTKWNASDAEILNEGTDFVEFTFDTAWSMPSPIMEALSKDFTHIEWLYADEDIGYNCGCVCWKNGELTFEDGDEEFAEKLWEIC